jgi:hypothetical protein
MICACVLLGNGSAELVSLKYPSDVDYTPRDTSDPTSATTTRIEQMIYDRGGPKKPSLVTATWESYKKTGPLLVSTKHRGTADG